MYTKYEFFTFILYLSTSALLIGFFSLISVSAQVLKPSQIIFDADRYENDETYIIDADVKNPQQIDPTKYLATVYFHKKEEFFPVSFNLNSTRDGNCDGKINVEDNIENYIRYRIGKWNEPLEIDSQIR